MKLVLVMLAALAALCVAQAPGTDCTGADGGAAVVDSCGVCGGNDQSCCKDYLGLRNNMWDWLLIQRAVDDQVVKLNDLKAMLACENAILPTFQNEDCDSTSDSNAEDREKVRDLMVRDFLETALDYNTCVKDYNALVRDWECDLNPASCCPAGNPALNGVLPDL